MKNQRKTLREELALTRAINRMGILLIVLGPMFTQYVFFFDFILLPEVFFLAMLPVFVLRRSSIPLGYFKYFILYLGLVLLLMFIAFFVQPFFDAQIAMTTYVRYLFYILIIMFFSYDSFDINYGAKALLAIASMNSIYGLIQFTSYHVFGKVLPWYLSFLNMKYGTLIVREYEYFFSVFGYRFSGLFSEPAHLSQYLATALILALFYKSESFSLRLVTRGLLIMLYSLTILISAAGTGVAILGFVFLLYLVWSFRESRRSLLSLLKKLFFVPFLLVVIILVLNNPTTSRGFTRVASLGDLSAMNVRVVRPFSIFLQLPLISQIIGIGYGNYSTFVFSMGMATSYEKANGLAWSNTAANILVGTGFLGFFIYYFAFYSFLTRTRGIRRYFVLLLIFFSFFSDLPLTFQLVTIMSFVVGYTDGIRMHNGISNKDYLYTLHK